MISKARASLLDLYAHRPRLINGVPYQTAATSWAWFWRDLILRMPPVVGLPVARALFDGGLAGWALPDLQGFLVTAAAAAAVFAVCSAFVFYYPSQQYRWTGGGLAIGGFFFLVSNPVVEELFWRAFLQDLLTDHITLAPALVITSLLFGFHHWFAGFGLRFIALATLGGLVFGGMFVYSQSLLAPVIAHSLADLALFVSGPPLKLRRSLESAQSLSS